MHSASISSSFTTELCNILLKTRQVLVLLRKTAYLCNWFRVYGNLYCQRQVLCNESAYHLLWTSAILIYIVYYDIRVFDIAVVPSIMENFALCFVLERFVTDFCSPDAWVGWISRTVSSCLFISMGQQCGSWLCVELQSFHSLGLQVYIFICASNIQ